MSLGMLRVVPGYPGLPSKIPSPRPKSVKFSIHNLKQFLKTTIYENVVFGNESFFLNQP